MYPLFELSCLLCLRPPGGKRLRTTQESPRIIHWAWSDVAGRTILVLVINNGNLLVRYIDRERTKPVIRQLPWLSGASNQISALCFDPTGAWLLCAVKDASLFIVPVLSFLDATVRIDQLWSLEDVTKIEMCGKRGEPPPTPLSSRTPVPGLERAQPTSVVWWQTQNSQQIAVVGNELGEICFINVLTRQEVGGTYITVAITTMDLIRDDTQDNVYLLITGSNGLQWQLLLEQPSQNYRWPLEQDDDQDPDTDGSVNIHKNRSNCKEVTADNENLQRDHRPQRISRFAGHTPLKPQNARGRHFVAGYYSPTSILSVHSTDMNIAPLFVYKLPPSCVNILLTDRLLFVTTAMKNQLIVLSNQLSESTIDGRREADPNAEVQAFTLPNDEQIVAIIKSSCVKFTAQRSPNPKPGPRSVPSSPRFGARIRRPSGSLGPALGSAIGPRRLSGRLSLVDRGEASLDDVKIATMTQLDGCVVVTETMVFECRPRTSPERLFLELVLAQQDMKASERLGVTLGLDVNKLYETTADYHLSQGHFAAAVRLYQLSKCPHVRSVANFAAHGCVGELLSYVRVLFSNQGVEFPLSDRRHFANMELLCYVHQILELKSGATVLMTAFKHFLEENRHYSEALAIQLLAEEGLYDMLGTLAEKRGLLKQMVEELLRPEPISWLDDVTMDALESRGFGMLTHGKHNDGYLKCLTMEPLIHHLLPNPSLSSDHAALLSRLMPHMKPDHLLSVVRLYDPTRLCTRNYLKHTVPTSRDTLQPGFMQAEEEDFSWERQVMETFLVALLRLNALRQNVAAFDLAFVAVDAPKIPSKIPVSPSKRPRLPRRSSPVGCGLAHAAVVRNGEMFTWGKTDHCCLGHGLLNQECVPPMPLDFFSRVRTKVLAVACGAWHTLALSNNGVFAWGMSKYGQLGSGFADKQPSPILIESLVDERIVSIACGQFHSMALTADGRVFSWGWGVHGQLGHGNTDDQPFPKLVARLGSDVAVKVTAGYGHSAVLTAKGDVYTFGCGLFGQLGIGNMNKNSWPQLVALPEKINLIACGYFHNVVVSASNKIYTWGSNPQLLRIQAQASRRARLQSKNTQSASSVLSTTDAVSDEKKLVETSMSTLLGPQGHLLPTLVEGTVTSPVTQVACGSHHSAVLTMDNDVLTWGRNLDGQLGNGSRKEQRSPTSIVGVTNRKITHVGCGSDFTVAIDSDGRVWGWGQNDCGQVGFDSDSSASGKTITIKTNKRIVQLRNTQQWGVVRPQEVAGIAPPRTAHEYETTRSFDADDEVESNGVVERRHLLLRKYHPLSAFEEPTFGLKTAHLMIEMMFGLYNHVTIASCAASLNLFQISAKVSLLQGQYTRSLEYHLRALKHGKHSKIEMIEAATHLIETYLGFLHPRDISATKTILQHTMNFWLDVNLSIKELEGFLTKWLPRFVQPIASLLLNPPTTESRLPTVLGKMSTKFCLSLVSALLVDLKSGAVSHDVVELLTAHAKNRLAATTAVSSHAFGIPSAPTTIVLRPKHIETLVTALEHEGSSSPSGTVSSSSEIELFSCGHHYTSRAFVSTVLPRFEASMRTLPVSLTRTTQALLASYRSEGLQPMACPRCVLIGIKANI